MKGIKLIDKLTKEHKDVVALLQEVQSKGIDSKKGRKKLLAAEDLFIEHLQREEDDLYPALQAAAVDNVELQDMLKEKYRDLQDVTLAAIAFFDKYSSTKKAPEFEQDFKQLFLVLTERIWVEQAEIFPIYVAAQKED